MDPAPGGGVSISGSTARALDGVEREIFGHGVASWQGAELARQSYKSLPSLQSSDDNRHNWRFNNFSRRRGPHLCLE